MATATEVVEEFKKKTVPQLRAYAKKNHIDLLGANTKVEILEAILPFVPTEEKAKAKKEQEAPKKKVALFSAKNLHWSGVGSLEKGYNIVTKEESVKWLKQKGVREATPAEVAKHYGKL